MFHWAPYGQALYLVAIILTACSSYREPFGQSDLKCLDCPLVEVTRIIDGYTFESTTGTVWLFGVDTPERGQRCYQEATVTLRKLAGAVVRAQRGPRIVDSYGRLLYYVYTPSGASIDEALIRRGLGKAWRQDGQHQDYLYQQELIAKTQGTGCLW